MAICGESLIIMRPFISLFFCVFLLFLFFFLSFIYFFSVFWVAFINGLNEISAWNKLSVMKRKKVKDDMFQDWLNGKVQNEIIYWYIRFYFFPLFLFFWKKFYHEEFKNSLKGGKNFFILFSCTCTAKVICSRNGV